MRASIYLLGTAVLGLSSFAADAQTTQNTQSLPTATPDSNRVSALPNTASSDRETIQRQQDRAAASLDPVGAHFGSFTVYPKIEGALIYDSNIYALERATDDMIAKISPSVTARGDAGSYTSTIRIALDRYQYFNKTKENRTDYAIGGNHRLELAAQTFLTANGAFSRNHEDRGDPSSLQTNVRPTVYNLLEAGAGFSRDLSTFRFGVDGGIRRFDYKDALQLNGSTRNNQDRDRNLYRITGRAGFEFSPGYTIVGRLGYDKVDYDRQFNQQRFQRSSDGLRASLGVGFELSRLLTGEVYGGYLRRNYDDARFRTISKPLYGATVTWYPTEITTIRLNADRSVEETVINNYSGYTSSTVSLSADHELTRTIKLSAGARYAHSDYSRAIVVNVPDRSDDSYGFNLGGRYILNRNLYTSVSYDFTYRNSTATTAGSDFKRHKLLASIGLQL